MGDEICCFTLKYHPTFLSDSPSIVFFNCRSVGKWRIYKRLSNSQHLYNLHPRAQQHNIIPSFKLPKLSVMSEENGHHVNIVYGRVTCFKMSIWCKCWLHDVIALKQWHRDFYCHSARNEAAWCHLCLPAHLRYRLNEWINSGVFLMRKKCFHFNWGSFQTILSGKPLTCIKITFQAFFCPDWKPMHERNAAQYIGDSTVYASYRSTGLSRGSDSLPDAEVTHNPGDQETQSYVPVNITQGHIRWHSYHTLTAEEKIRYVLYINTEQWLNRCAEVYKQHFVSSFGSVFPLQINTAHFKCVICFLCVHEGGNEYSEHLRHRIQMFKSVLVDFGLWLQFI